MLEKDIKTAMIMELNHSINKRNLYFPNHETKENDGLEHQWVQSMESLPWSVIRVDLKMLDNAPVLELNIKLSFFGRIWQYEPVFDVRREPVTEENIHELAEKIAGDFFTNVCALVCATTIKEGATLVQNYSTHSSAACMVFDAIEWDNYCWNRIDLPAKWNVPKQPEVI